MSERLSRQQLYDLVWSEPIRSLAVRFGISDVALKKTCARAAIPTPDRGYWAKKEAGKPRVQATLPCRAPAMDDEVFVAGGNDFWYRSRTEDELLGPVPNAPEFNEPIDAVRERAVKVVGRISVPREVRNWHPGIARLLKEDGKRREKQRSELHSFSWEKPLFDTPLEMRRLRIFNSLILGAARMNGKLSIHGREARDVDISFYRHSVFIALDRPAESHRRGHLGGPQKEPNGSNLILSIREDHWSKSSSGTWQDDENGKLETKLAEIVVEMVVSAETQYRQGAIRQYEWRVKRKAEIEEERLQRKIEAELAERERQVRIEQARVDRIMKDAAAFQRASEIRKYVEAIRSAASCDQTALSMDFQRWSTWALGQANRIDPAIEGRFLISIKDGEA